MIKRVIPAIIAKSQEEFEENINKVKDYDGLKFYLAGESWILFRLSGTEPILRIYAEAESLAKTRKLITAGKNILSL